jgi:hypothetical protein
MLDGPDKWDYIHGPLNIDASNYARGILAFFYQQNDDKPPNVDFANGELVITDKLSDRSITYRVENAVWKF